VKCELQLLANWWQKTRMKAALSTLAIQRSTDAEMRRCGDAIRDAMSEWLMRFVMQPILGCRPCGCGKIAPGISTGITADNADPLFGFT